MKQRWFPKMLIAWAMMIVMVAAAESRAVTIPPLTEPQAEQLNSATDGDARYDEGALYPLLQNVSHWNNAPAEANYLQMLSNPSKYRGDIMTVRGEFGNAMPVDIVRSGPWGEKLTMWGVRVREGQIVNGVKQPDFNVAIFFINDGKPLRNPGKPGTPVTIVCRFYKVWQTTSKEGNKSNYLTFVSSPAAIVSVGGRVQTTHSKSSNPASNSSGWSSLADERFLVLLVVVALGMGYYAVRRFAGKRTVPPTRRQRKRRDAREEVEARRKRRAIDEAAEDDPDAENLPPDPAAAMEELERRHRESSDD